MVVDGEPVRLVPDPLEEVQSFGASLQADRIWGAGTKHLFELLGQGGHWDLVGQTQVGHHPFSDPQLSLAAVHEEELGRVGKSSWPFVDGQGPFFQEGGQPAGQDLGHSCVVVVAVDVADPEPPVLRFVG